MDVTIEAVRRNGRWVMRISVPEWMVDDLEHESETDTLFVEVLSEIPYASTVYGHVATGRKVVYLNGAVKLKPSDYK